VAGIDVLHVPYKGAAAAVTDLIGRAAQLRVHHAEHGCGTDPRRARYTARSR